MRPLRPRQHRLQRGGDRAGQERLRQQPPRPRHRQLPAPTRGPRQVPDRQPGPAPRPPRLVHRLRQPRPHPAMIRRHVHAAAGQPHPFPRHRQHQVHRPGQRNRRRRQRGREVQPGQLRRDHLRELPGGIAAQVHRDHARQQPGQGRVVEPGRQHVLPPLPHRPAQRRPPLHPGPVPIEILGRDEHHHRGRLLPVDGRQLLGQVPAPQPDLLIRIIETAQPPRLQRTGDLLDVVPLRPGERQRHIPPPPQPGTRAAIPSRHDGQSPTRRPASPIPRRIRQPGYHGTHRPAA